MKHLANKTDTEELKKFARTMVWAFPFVFSLVLPWLFNYRYQTWPLAISALLSLFYFIRPSLIFYPYRAWMTLALLLGWVNTRIILSAIFFLMILPIGVLLRLFNKLQYQHKPNPASTSFYLVRDNTPTGKQLEYPF